MLRSHPFSFLGLFCPRASGAWAELALQAFSTLAREFALHNKKYVRRLGLLTGATVRAKGSNGFNRDIYTCYLKDFGIIVYTYIHIYIYTYPFSTWSPLKGPCKSPCTGTAGDWITGWNDNCNVAGWVDTAIFGAKHLYTQDLRSLC